MNTAGHHRSGVGSKLIALVIVCVALGVAWYALSVSQQHPSTSDAAIQADVVHVAASVGGRIVEISVRENSFVRKGDLLFQIDPIPYQMAVDQSQADLDVAEAQLVTQRKDVSTQRSNAAIARDQTATAQANYELATRSAERLRPLTEKGYVPNQQLDQANTAASDAATQLQQSRARAAAAAAAVNTVKSGESAVAARMASLALAKHHLQDTTVRAPHDGLVVGLTVSTGEYVGPGQALFTLINTEEWYADANFRETELGDVQVGDCATVYSMIDRRRPVKGVVQGVGWGVTNKDLINLPRSVPYVQPSLNWVQVAQRFPVRIRLENPPREVMRVGASAVVEIKHGSECR